MKNQFYGVPSPDAGVSFVEGGERDDRFVARCSRDGRATGVLGWNKPGQARLHRQALLGTPASSPVPGP